MTVADAPSRWEDPFRGLPTRDDFPNAPIIEDDPVPFLTNTFDKYGAFERAEPRVALGDAMASALMSMGFDLGSLPPMPTVGAMSAVQGATQSLVSALSLNPDHFSVRLAPIETAATSMDAKRKSVFIGARAMVANGLTDGQRAAVVMGMAYHEVGHVNWSLEWGARLASLATARSWSTSRKAWSSRILNLAHDLMLEFLMATQFPGFANALPCKNLFNSTPWLPTERTIADRFNNGISRGRFPWTSDWTPFPALDAFWGEWTARCQTERALDAKVMTGLIEEALDMIRPDEPDPVDDEPTDEEEPPRRGKGGDDDEPTDGPTGPGGDDDEPEDEGEDEDPDGEGGDDDGDDGDDEDGDGDGDEPDDSEDGDDGDEGEDGDDDADEPTDKRTGKGESKDGHEPDDEAPEVSDDDGVDDGSEKPEPTESVEPKLHEEADPLSKAYQTDVDALDRAQVAGRDKRIVGGGEFHKREARILRLPQKGA